MRYRGPLIIVSVVVFLSGIAYFTWRASMRTMAEKAVVRAANLLQRGEAQRTRDELQWPLWLNPNDAKALQLMGMSYVRQKKWTEAIAYLERIPANDSTQVDSQIHLAAALLADRQFERAEITLSTLMLKSPASLMGVRLLSGLLLTELRREEAVAILEAYLQHQAEEKVSFADYLLILRDLSTAEFHPPLAQDCLPILNESLQRHPDQPSVQLALGQAEMAAGHEREAESLLRASLQQRPLDGKFRLALCEFLVESGRVEDAAQILEARDVNRDAENHAQLPEARYWTIKSRIAELGGDFLQALDAQDRATSFRPIGKDELARRGRLLQRLNRHTEAQAANTRTHEWARAELDLWNLSRDLGGRMPTPADCEAVAELYETVQKPLTAAAWRRIVRLRESESASISSPPESSHP